MASDLDDVFFNEFWSLILDDIVCDTRFDPIPFFEPEQRFDDLWFHTLLATTGFNNYYQPIELRCYKTEEDELGAVEEIEKSKQATNELLCCKRPILSLDQHKRALNDAQERRQSLAYKFVNRQHPYYAKPSPYNPQAIITNLSEFDKFETDILRHIQTYECGLMIIDLGPDVNISYMERWQKFSPLVPIIPVVRYPKMLRQLKLLVNKFKPLLLEENLENSWHEELVCSLEEALKYAKSLKLQQNCVQSFVYVFSKYRNMHECDTYKVMRKF